MKNYCRKLTIIKPLIIIAIAVGACSASAGIISFGNTSISNPGKFESFERVRQVPNYEVINTQFLSNGISFVSNSGTAPLIHNNYCVPSNNFGGIANVAIGVTRGCGVSRTTTSASIMFSDTVQDLSFNYASNNSSAYTFEALLSGSVVSSLAISNQIVPRQTSFLFSGSLFDEIRFTSTSGSNWFWMDDLAWNASPSQVPEPTSIALLGLGLAGLGFYRRKKA